MEATEVFTAAADVLLPTGPLLPPAADRREAASVAAGAAAAPQAVAAALAPLGGRALAGLTAGVAAELPYAAERARFTPGAVAAPAAVLATEPACPADCETFIPAPETAVPDPATISDPTPLNAACLRDPAPATAAVCGAVGRAGLRGKRALSIWFVVRPGTVAVRADAPHMGTAGDFSAACAWPWLDAAEWLATPDTFLAMAAVAAALSFGLSLWLLAVGTPSLALDIPAALPAADTSERLLVVLAGAGASTCCCSLS